MAFELSLARRGMFYRLLRISQKW